jgi:hypothetical protein
MHTLSAGWLHVRHACAVKQEVAESSRHAAQHANAQHANAQNANAQHTDPCTAAAVSGRLMLRCMITCHVRRLLSAMVKAVPRKDVMAACALCASSRTFTFRPRGADELFTKQLRCVHAGFIE